MVIPKRNPLLPCLIRILSIVIIVLFLTLWVHNAAIAQDTGDKEPVVIKSVYGDYDEVWEDIKTALNERGLTVSSVSHVGEMLERTAPFPA